MWPEVSIAKEEKRHELVLSGPTIDEYLKECNELDPEIFLLNELNFLKISSTNLQNLSINIKCLSNMTNLVLQGNQLVTLPNEVGELSKLKLLDVSQNKLVSIPTSLGDLKNLSTLNANNNNLSKVENLQNCCVLAHLDLRNNSLEYFPEVLSENLSLLADVLLSSNKILEIPNNISVLSSLKILNLESNDLKEVPGEIVDCTKLKELHLKGNPLSDKRFKKLVENDRTLPRQVLDYVRQHTSKQGGSSKGKKGKKGKDKKNEIVEELNELSNQLHILRVSDDNPEVQITDNVKEIRPYIICCVIKSLDLSGEKFKQFLTVQTQLHETICEKRCAATIATHDISKVSTQLRYVALSPEEMKIQPLGYAKEIIAKNFVNKLQKEADVQRKQQKRNNVSGIHKYLHLLDEKLLWSCLIDKDNTVLSMHPITNSEKSKISPETTGILIEVTSSTSLAKAREVMERLILTILELGATSEHTSSDHKIIKIQQTRVLNEDGSLRVMYPTRSDFNLNNSRLQVVFLDKDGKC